jgi:hypothetical protein
MYDRSAIFKQAWQYAKKFGTQWQMSAKNFMSQSLIQAYAEARQQIIDDVSGAVQDWQKARLLILAALRQQERHAKRLLDVDLLKASLSLAERAVTNAPTPEPTQKKRGSDGRRGFFKMLSDAEIASSSALFSQ